MVDITRADTEVRPYIRIGNLAFMGWFPAIRQVRFP
jgi:hypothetical protein